MYLIKRIYIKLKINENFINDDDVEKDLKNKLEKDLENKSEEDIYDNIMNFYDNPNNISKPISIEILCNILIYHYHINNEDLFFKYVNLIIKLYINIEAYLFNKDLFFYDILKYDIAINNKNYYMAFEFVSMMKNNKDPNSFFKLIYDDNKELFYFNYKKNLYSNLFDYNKENLYSNLFDYYNNKLFIYDYFNILKKIYDKNKEDFFKIYFILKIKYYIKLIDLIKNPKNYFIKKYTETIDDFFLFRSEIEAFIIFDNNIFLDYIKYLLNKKADEFMIYLQLFKYIKKYKISIIIYDFIDKNINDIVDYVFEKNKEYTSKKNISKEDIKKDIYDNESYIVNNIINNNYEYENLKIIKKFLDSTDIKKDIIDNLNENVKNIENSILYNVMKCLFKTNYLNNKYYKINNDENSSNIYFLYINKNKNKNNKSLDIFNFINIEDNVDTLLFDLKSLSEIFEIEINILFIYLYITLSDSAYENYRTYDSNNIHSICYLIKYCKNKKILNKLLNLSLNRNNELNYRKDNRNLIEI